MQAKRTNLGRLVFLFASTLALLAVDRSLIAQDAVANLPTFELESPLDGPASPAEKEGNGDFPNGIYVMDANGENLRRVLRTPERGFQIIGSPAWSRDGTRIAVDAAPNGGWNHSHILVVDVKGPSTGKIVDLGCGLIPSWSPDDQSIAFMLHPGNPNREPQGIWVMKADGTDRRRVGPGAMPAWSPKRNTIACVARWNIPREILLIDVESGTSKPMFPKGKAAAKSRLAWWPDGEHLIFAPYTPVNNELFWLAHVDRPVETIRAIGALPNDAANTSWGYPAISPDGKTLAFPMKSGFPEVKSIGQLGMAPNSPVKTFPLPEDFVSPGDPAWSPDGKHLIFVEQ